jgi:hypothetical protein
MRDFFLDCDEGVPPAIQVFAWPYPSNLIVIARGIGFVQPGGSTLVCDVLKFFPLAYLMAFERPASVNINLPALAIPRAIHEREFAELQLDFRRRVRVDWPEQPDPDDMILFNDDMTIVAESRATAA